MEEFEHAIELYKQKRYNWETSSILKIDQEEVRLVQKNNSHHLICTCPSSGRTGHNSLCRHKILFIYLPLLEKLDNKLSNLILEYDAGKSGIKDEKTKSILNQIINDLDNLRKFK